MTGPTFSIDKLYTLSDIACDGALTKQDFVQLEQLLHGNVKAQQYYLKHVCLDRWMRWEFAHQVQEPLPPCSPSPVFGFLSTAYHGTIGFFSQELPFSLLIAAVLTSLGLWFASVIYVSSPEKIAKDSSPPVKSSFDPTLKVVGKVTGMDNCKWADPNTETFNGANVLLGRKYVLASGLMEITYDTGAKVILQGPVTYKVESRNGGFLPIGKLTGKMENEAARGFAVRTPTATVTDLGTEFGVEVSKEGHTTSHVFRGSVEVRLATDGKVEATAQVLHENESARVERTRLDDSSHLMLNRIAVDPCVFVRRMVHRPKTLDLLDIVAGGNGTEGNREHGIDPTTGMEDPSFLSVHRKDNQGYHRVSWKINLIDGVFVPNGGIKPVVLDSAGHTCDNFPHTAGKSFGSIWARAASVKSDDREKDPQQWVYSMGRGEQYMPDRRGLLGLHPNTGITFDLEAVRKRYPNIRPSRFRAVAGVACNENVIDVWVFVDGNVKLRRSGLHHEDGAIRMDVELSPVDRFLTLVSTCGEQYQYAWFVFGDPVLEMVSNNESQQ